MGWDATSFGSTAYYYRLILKPEVAKDEVAKEYVEKMVATERYVLTANKLPGTLTYFVPENERIQRQIEALSPKSAARAAQEDALPVEDVAEAAPAEQPDPS